MRIIQKVIILLLAAISFVNISAQQKSIVRGRIIDSKENIPVIGANVIEYDKNNRVINGTTTNLNGDFVLQMLDPSHVVKISAIGYVTQTIQPDFHKPMTIKMAVSNIKIGEVTVTAQTKSTGGLTNINERDNASSVVKVDLAEMKDAGVVSAADALQGKVAGLDIVSASGDPGSGSQLVIRGLSSIGNSRPLIVVDGIPQFRVSGDVNLSGANTQDISNMVNIAIQDIKSITVLKDAASTAIYGSRGADGVLLIETEKGRMGRVKFDYQFKGSLNIQPPAIPMLNGDEYIMLQLEELHNSMGVFEVPPEIAYDHDYIDFYNYSANTDWLGAITQNAFTSDQYFKVSGGGEKTRYYTSFNYVNEGGTTINTSAKRLGARILLDYYLSRKFLFEVQFNYTYNKIRGNPVIGSRNIREMAYMKAPNMSIWEHDAEGNLTGEYFNPINNYQGSGSVYFNPVAVAELGKSDRVINLFENTFRVRYNLLKWLIFRETITLQYNGSKSNNFLPYNALGTDWLAWTVNKAEESNNNNTRIRTETQFSFNSPFNNKNHVLSGVATWITEQSSYEWMNLQSNKTPSTKIQDPAINAQINWIGNGSGMTRTLSGLVNLNYSYKDRYLVQTNLRTDAFSGFGSNNRWGLFYGVSVGWRFSSESFMQQFTWLGDSKLRASYGVSGRQPSDPYARFATYNSTPTGGYLENSAVVPTQIRLNNLQWESISSFDLGLDLYMFNDRLYFMTDLYNKVTTNLLFPNYRIPSSSGFNRLKYLNGGELQNRGWEMMTDYKIINSHVWLWSVNLNISQNFNSFTKLPENFNTERSTSIGNGEYPKKVIVGEPIGSFFGFRYLGVYPSDADAMARDEEGNIIYDNEGHPIPMTYQGSYQFKGGDAKYEDINHDGKIDLNDVVYIGNSNPKFIGGFGSSLKYRNLTLSFAFYYRLGFDIINQVALETEGMNNKNNQSKAVLNRWRVEGQDEPGMLPRAYMYNPANNLGSDRYVEKGNFLRLNNIMLSYLLNEKMCSKLHVRTLSLSASARKLFTLTNYSGQDPEVGQDASDPFWIGVDRANTPPPQIITFSVAVGF